MNMKQLFYQHQQADICKLDGGPLKGLRHRTVIEGDTGSSSLALWQEEHLPGFSVPLHMHDCEEIITVLEGQIKAVINKRTFILKKEESILIPTWEKHGFTVISDVPVKLLAIFSSNRPRIYKEDGSMSSPPWQGGGSSHLSSLTTENSTLRIDK